MQARKTFKRAWAALILKSESYPALEPCTHVSCTPRFSHMSLDLLFLIAIAVGYTRLFLVRAEYIQARAMRARHVSM